MTYRERQRLDDIQAAIDAIGSHLQRGDLSDGLIFGEADIVAERPDNSLLYYFAWPSSPFYTATVAGSGSTFSAP